MIPPSPVLGPGLGGIMDLGLGGIMDSSTVIIVGLANNFRETATAAAAAAVVIAFLLVVVDFRLRIMI